MKKKYTSPKFETASFKTEKMFANSIINVEYDDETNWKENITAD